MVDDRVEISTLAEDLRVTDRIMGLNPGLFVSHRLHGAGPGNGVHRIRPRADAQPLPAPTERFVLLWLRPRATGK